MSDCYKFWRWPARHQALQIELANEKHVGNDGVHVVYNYIYMYIDIYIYIFMCMLRPPHTYLGP